MNDFVNLLIDHQKWHEFSYKTAPLLHTHTHILPWTSVVLYLLMVFGLPKILKKPLLPNWLINGIMAIWNLSLSIMSLLILVFVLPTKWNEYQQYGFWEPSGVFCDSEEHNMLPGITMFACYMFAISKYLELFDTLWLILKKPDRPVPFLHWFHHATVLLFTWYAEKWRFSVGFFFIIMNAFIHTVMYFYYFLTSIRIDPSFMAMPLTIGQISQMFIGIAIVGTWAKLYYVDEYKCMCDEPEILVFSCALMYGSYFFLFVKFFIERYILGKKKVSIKKKKQ
jgi:elongation of very long chain fatty acids protein 6